MYERIAAFLLTHRMASEHKILILVDGVDYNVIKVKPPMCFTKENADYFLKSFDEVLSSAS